VKRSTEVVETLPADLTTNAMESIAMKASLRLPPSSSTSKLDRTDWTRELWRAAYRQSRAMIRDGGRFGLGARYVHGLNHLRRRFGASGWPLAQKAASLAFDLRTVSKAATGSREELARQGMLSRCVRLEPAPRGLGWCWAFTFDELGSPNTARSLRRLRAKRLREDRAQVMAQLEADERLYVLTDLGRGALVAAGLAADRVALSPRTPA
jgi:hypothetical protein